MEDSTGNNNELRKSIDTPNSLSVETPDPVRSTSRPSMRKSPRDLLDNQVNIISALSYAPSMLAEYVNYRGSEPVTFKGATISIPSVPFIPYNEDDICCLLDRIVGAGGTVQTCRGLNVSALGPRGKVGIPYIIKEENGDTLIVKLTKVNKLYSTYLINPPTSLIHLVGNQREIRACISDVKLGNIRYIASDEFTNETLISYILNYLIEKSVQRGIKLPLLFVRHYQAGVCESKTVGEVLGLESSLVQKIDQKFAIGPSTESDVPISTVGLNIMENCDLGPLDKLQDQPQFQQYIQEYQIEDNGRQMIMPLVRPDILLQILIQVTAGLHMLQTHISFTSGDLKAGNVFVKSEPIDIDYMGIKIKAPFTCKIADYGKSSCMLYKKNGTALRFYNESSLANIYLSFHPFEHDITVEGNEFFYTVGHLFNSQIYTRTRHMGIPYYQSFDYYTVLVSILTNPAFYYIFFATDILRKVFWDPIWKDDSSEALKRIHQYIVDGGGRSVNDALNILRGLKLRCNAVHLVMKNLLLLEIKDFG
ncbi:Hypothetical protein HVR_LOCUS1117 [uncultured virus]|nr:Hypothetical protein HVR_LOCUS1117 [uncultured virus]